MCSRHQIEVVSRGVVFGILVVPILTYGPGVDAKSLGRELPFVRPVDIERIFLVRNPAVVKRILNDVVQPVITVPRL